MMPSTEFLLYLVIVIFAVFLIMNYYRETPTEQQVHYKYIPVYNTSVNEEYDNNGNGGNGSEYSQYSQSQSRTQKKKKMCRNPQCMQYGRCMCGGGDNVDININNVQEGVSFPSGGPGMLPGGPGMLPGGPGVLPGGPGMLPGGPGGAIPPIDPLRKFDYDSVYDEFTPPFRRSYYDDYNYRLAPGLFPTYTRGPPGRFRKVGTLVAEGVSPNDKYKFLLLMGRQKYPGRDEYQYYATSSNTEQKIKFYIETKEKKYMMMT